MSSSSASSTARDLPRLEPKRLHVGIRAQEESHLLGLLREVVDMDLTGADVLEVADRDGPIADLAGIDLVDGQVSLPESDGADGTCTPPPSTAGQTLTVG